VDDLAFYSGYFAVAVIVCAALMPVVARVQLKRRAAPDSTTTKVHVALGITAAVCTFLHTLGALPSLGSPAATGAGNLALLPAAFAFLVVVSHSGIGLQLRDTRLKDRTRKRRIHLFTAALIFLSVGTHIVLLRQARTAL
jgi:hypothetical protein